jgi:hypothetical protein
MTCSRHLLRILDFGFCSKNEGLCAKATRPQRGTRVAFNRGNATGAKPWEPLTLVTELSRFCAAWIHSFDAHTENTESTE